MSYVQSCLATDPTDCGALKWPLGQGGIRFPNENVLHILLILSQLLFVPSLSQEWGFWRNREGEASPPPVKETQMMLCHLADPVPSQ